MNEKLKPIDRDRKTPEQVLAQIDRINKKLGERIVGLAIAGKDVSGVRPSFVESGKGKEKVSTVRVRLPKTLEYGDNMWLETSTQRPQDGVHKQTANVVSVGDWKSDVVKTTPQHADGSSHSEYDEGGDTHFNDKRWNIEANISDSGYEEVGGSHNNDGKGLSGQMRLARKAETDHEVPMVDAKVTEALSSVRQATVDAARQLNGQ